VTRLYVCGSLHGVMRPGLRGPRGRMGLLIQLTFSGRWTFTLLGQVGHSEQRHPQLSHHHLCKAYIKTRKDEWSRTMKK
jgi:hypothetical protein